jgi:hypothetical protein
MKNAILQIWEESFSDEKIVPDGATLHINEKERNEYVDKVYKFRKEFSVPEKYSRICGTQIEVNVSEVLYSKLETMKSVKLEEWQFNNLVKFKEIV